MALFDLNDTGWVVCHPRKRETGRRVEFDSVATVVLDLSDRLAVERHVEGGVLTGYDGAMGVWATSGEEQNGQHDPNRHRDESDYR